jgi:hypothetical protein
MYAVYFLEIKWRKTRKTVAFKSSKRTSDEVKKDFLTDNWKNVVKNFVLFLGFWSSIFGIIELYNVPNVFYSKSHVRPITMIIYQQFQQ